MKLFMYLHNKEPGIQFSGFGQYIFIYILWLYRFRNNEQVPVLCMIRP